MRAWDADGKGIGGFIGANTNDDLATVTFTNCEFSGSITTKDYTTAANTSGTAYTEAPKSGCKSAIGAASAIALMVTVIGTAIVAKKED